MVWHYFCPVLPLQHFYHFSFVMTAPTLGKILENLHIQIRDSVKRQTNNFEIVWKVVMLSFIIKGSHTISPRRALGQAKSSCIKGILTNLWFVISRHTLLIPTAVRAALEFSTAFHVVAALLWSRGTRRRRRNVRTRTWLFALRCCTNKKNISMLFTYKTTSTKIIYNNDNNNYFTGWWQKKRPSFFQRLWN